MPSPEDRIINDIKSCINRKGGLEFQWITQAETAKRLGVSDRTLRNLENFVPPRLPQGRGSQGTLYCWPATSFWFNQTVESMREALKTYPPLFDEIKTRLHLNRTLKALECGLDKLPEDLSLQLVGKSASQIRAILAEELGKLRTWASFESDAH